MDGILYLVIKDSEDSDVGDIDLYSELLDDNVLFFKTPSDIISWHEEEEDLSECKVVKIKIEGSFKIVNNPKFVEIPLTKSSTKKNKK